MSDYRDDSTDTAIASDSTFGGLRSVFEDVVRASDALFFGIAITLSSTAIASDEVVARRYVSTLVHDTAIASDTLLYSRADTLTDTATVSDTAQGKLYAHELITDTAMAIDSVIDTVIQRSIVTDTAITTDTVIDTLHASYFWTDVVVAQDELISTGGYRGQTWTANTDTWAMSRYEPYNFSRLVVIDGVLFGEADDGIYRLDQEITPVTAIIKTAKIDLSGGPLTHPSSSYLEYELIGQASMTVHTTQKGMTQQYSYVLPNELADELTNGRFIFGRGLRGRHFSFELTMVGTHGYINDLSVDHVSTSRRV